MVRSAHPPLKQGVNARQRNRRSDAAELSNYPVRSQRTRLLSDINTLFPQSLLTAAEPCTRQEDPYASQRPTTTAASGTITVKIGCNADDTEPDPAQEAPALGAAVEPPLCEQQS